MPIHKRHNPSLSTTRCREKVVAPIVSDDARKHLEMQLLQSGAKARSRFTLLPPLSFVKTKTIRESMESSIAPTFCSLGLNISGKNEERLFRELRIRKFLQHSPLPPLPIDYKGKKVMKKVWCLDYGRLFHAICRKYGVEPSIELINLREATKHSDSKVYRIGEGNANSCKVAFWYSCRINTENYAPEVHNTFARSILGTRDFLVIITPFFEPQTDVQMRFFRSNHVVILNLFAVLHNSAHTLQTRLSREIHSTLSQEKGVSIEEKLRECRLTDAEIAVVQEFARTYPSNCSNKEIATQRGVTTRTIKTQLNTIYRKLNITGTRRGNRIGLIKHLKSLNRNSYRSFIAPPQ